MNEFDCQLKIKKDKEYFWRTMNAEKVTSLITAELDLTDNQWWMWLSIWSEQTRHSIKTENDKTRILH